MLKGNQARKKIRVSFVRSFFNAVSISAFFVVASSSSVIGFRAAPRKVVVRKHPKTQKVRHVRRTLGARKHSVDVLKWIGIPYADALLFGAPRPPRLDQLGPGDGFDDEGDAASPAGPDSSDEEEEADDEVNIMTDGVDTLVGKSGALASSGIPLKHTDTQEIPAPS